MLSDHDQEKRQYPRYEVHYDAEIYQLPGHVLVDHTRLKNISGGGVRLLTLHPENYRIGQLIVLSIPLPPTDRLSARLKGHGKVVWVGEPAPEGRTPIGVLMVDPLTFEQSPVEPDQAGGER